jgi:transcriptional regulator with XRE-family HTH domain
VSAGATIGSRIRATRTAAGITQAALAEAAGVAANTVARIERGEQEPSALVLGRIAAALRVSADYLLGLPE